MTAPEVAGWSSAWLRCGRGLTELVQELRLAAQHLRGMGPHHELGEPSRLKLWHELQDLSPLNFVERTMQWCLEQQTLTVMARIRRVGLQSNR